MLDRSPPRLMPNGAYRPDDLLDWFRASLGAPAVEMARELGVSVDRINYFTGPVGWRQLERRAERLRRSGA